MRAAGSSLTQELEKNGFQLQLTLEGRFQLWTKDPLSRQEARSAGGVSFEGLDDALRQGGETR